MDFSKIKLPITIEEIKNIIPHRYPFLLIDRIIKVDAKIIEGYKNITANEEFFSGHFPEKPIMPGVLMVEALAQLGCCQLMLSKDLPKDKIGVFGGIDKLKFKSPVFPGDRLDLKCELLWERGNENNSIGKSLCVASVEGRIAVSGELMFALVKKEALN